jgi:hypothetical protein
MLLNKYENWYIFEVIGQLAKNVDPKEIDQEFIVNLKLEVDEMFDQGRWYLK